MGDSRSQGSSTTQGGEDGGSTPSPAGDCTHSAPEAAGPSRLLREHEGTGKESPGEAEASPQEGKGPVAWWTFMSWDLYRFRARLLNHRA